MITDRIGLHEVLLLINHKKYNLREEKYSEVMTERENLHLKTDIGIIVSTLIETEAVIG